MKKDEPNRYPLTLEPNRGYPQFDSARFDSNSFIRQAFAFNSTPTSSKISFSNPPPHVFTSTPLHSIKFFATPPPRSRGGVEFWYFSLELYLLTVDLLSVELFVEFNGKIR
jgi:hypothetical protein